MFTDCLPGVLKSLEKDYYLRSIRAKGFKIKNLPNNLEDVLKHYRDCLKEAYNTNICLVKGETFTQEFVLDDGISYNISWNITIAKKLIENSKTKVTSFSVEELYEQVKKKEIDLQHLSKAITNKEPIIIAYYPSSPQPNVVIDGNHRVAANYRAGIKEIDTYVLNPNEHLQAMTSEFDRLLFGIYFNLAWIGDFIIDEITFEQMVERLAPI